MLILTYLFCDFTFLHGLDLVISVNEYQIITYKKSIRCSFCSKRLIIYGLPFDCFFVTVILDRHPCYNNITAQNQ